MDKETLKKNALDYHEFPRPGKLAIEVMKPSKTAKDLALAYSPGVACPVMEIAENPENAYKYTNKGNLVAVISNGSAILGLGNRGPLASKPVMEGKGVLFKVFAGIDVYDLEVDVDDITDFISTVKAVAPTFGGINLEDIKAPECFQVEFELRKQLNIPVFHDDQHGTAIVVAAALLNALEIRNKKMDEVEIVCMGAGAAGIATVELLIRMGARKDNIIMLDSQGVIHTDRHGLGPYKFAFARQTDKRTVSDAMAGADVFIGVSGPDLLTAEHLKLMAKNPVVFALSNPDPEISPKLVAETRDDVIMATGRSDFPNQVNNVLCFPYIFRGALDVRARVITVSMCVAAAKAIAKLAKEPVPQEVLDSYEGVDTMTFGPEYLIPKPMDPRLLNTVAPAVAKAAIEADVAKLPYPKHYPNIEEV